ncbi:hypothetical protein [Lentzea aerocolonigenes]|uniref:hypothetical protein n=1 Tax=Lentzea aerocolonigenes TaxID=68170 RepID=UPI000A88D148|nr:hypothetical protein [Lentzea aerocolonigenes]MCP2250114.1 hypothetical protein [Lentzea aerocolonigenes]
MRVTDESGSGCVWTAADAQTHPAPRVYALDIVVPDEGDPLVVDVNGARSGVEPQRLLHGDDRVQEAVLTPLAEAGGGVITTVSQTTPAPLQDRFCAARLRLAGSRCGWYEAADAYVPVGDPAARGREQLPAATARRLGIDYRAVTVDWREDRFVVLDRGKTCDLRDWRPEGIVWPYAWDQRVLPLPLDVPVCNPLPYSLPTTNKLLANHLLADVGVPPTRPAGLWLPGSPLLAEQAAGPRRLTVVKPAVGRRSFGVVLTPTERLPEIAPDLGLVSARAGLDRTAELTVLGLLWGQATELLALAQPYVPPRLRRHPETGAMHTSIARATVVVERDVPRCVDVCAFLVPEPHGSTRGGLMLTGAGGAAVVALADGEALEVRRAAETVVARLEEAVRTRLRGPSGAEIVRAEIGLMVELLEAGTDCPVDRAWQAHRDTITGYEAFDPGYTNERAKA